jgi:hypothetical protein
VIIRYKRLYDDRHAETVGGETVELPRLDCAVEVSLTRRNLPTCPADAPRFLAVVDSAFSRTLLIREALVQRWAGCSVSARSGPAAPGRRPSPIVLDKTQALLRPQSNVTLVDASGVVQTHPTYEADLWLHPYQSRTHHEPFRIPLIGGFVLFPSPMNSGPDGPPLPLLGALALRRVGLKLTVNYAKLDFCIQEG